MDGSYTNEGPSMGDPYSVRIAKLTLPGPLILLKDQILQQNTTEVATNITEVHKHYRDQNQHIYPTKKYYWSCYMLPKKAHPNGGSYARFPSNNTTEVDTNLQRPLTKRAAHNNHQGHQ